jgi:hypothetical protein
MSHEGPTVKKKKKKLLQTDGLLGLFFQDIRALAD